MLVAIACLQLYLAHAHYLSPWKGGGFGMFASIDSRRARFLRYYLVTADGDIPVEAPARLRPLIDEIRALPRFERMLYLADQLAQATWEPDASSPANHKPVRFIANGEMKLATGQAVEFWGVRVELWRYGFDPEHRHLKADKLLEVTAEKK
jgi:hypothetical protein